MTPPNILLWFLWAFHLTQNLTLTTQAGPHGMRKGNKEEASGGTDPTDENPGAVGQQMKAKRSQQFDDEGGEDICEEHRSCGDRTAVKSR